MENNKIKVLAITKPLSGSHFWRIFYPLSKINGSIVEDKEIEVTFKDFDDSIPKEAENYNILIYHWDIGLSIQEIGRLQSIGVKVIYSIDDFWEFSDYHPYYNSVFSRSYAQNRTKHHMINADGVIVTTERLALHAMKYNDNVAILPNFANPEEFKQFGTKTPSDKLRVGIIGSLSHVPDWMLLKGTINRIAKNKELAEKIEFHICGVVKDDKNWDEVIKLFTVKKNLKVVIKEYQPLDKYLELYNELDVILMPLEFTEFNHCKSALKLWECLVTNTIPLGSSLYAQKELKGIGVCESPIDYEKALIELLDKEYYNKVLEHINKVNSEDNKWELRLEHTKAVINTAFIDDLSPKLDDVKIYGICYSGEQYTEYNKYDNSHIRTLAQKSWRFEWNAILDIIANKLDDFNGYLGIFSWKFNLKSGFTKNILYKTLNHKKFKDYDFVNLSRNYWKDGKEYMKFTEHNHPGILERLEEVCNVIGLNYTDKPDNIVYSNFFMLKSEYYKDFVNNYVVPALEYMESNPERFMIDAQYHSTKDKYKGGLSLEELKKYTELEYYPMVTFLLERLILFYIQDKKLKTLNVL
jgi:hypothetical protein